MFFFKNITQIVFIYLISQQAVMFYLLSSLLTTSSDRLQQAFGLHGYVLQQLNLANVTTRICTQGGFVNFVYIVQ